MKLRLIAWMALCLFASATPVRGQSDDAPKAFAPSTPIDLRVDVPEAAAPAAVDADELASEDDVKAFVAKVGQAPKAKAEAPAAAAPGELPPVPSLPELTGAKRRSRGTAATKQEPEAPAIKLKPDESLAAGVKTDENLWDRLGQNDKGQQAASGSWYLNTFAALAVVIALIFAARYVLARASGRSLSNAGGGVVEVLWRAPVAGKSHIVLVRVGQRMLILSESGGGMNTLAEVSDPEEMADLLARVSSAKPTSISESFSNLMDRFNRGHSEDVVDTIELGGDDGEYQTDRTRDQVTGLLARLRQMKAGGASNA